MPRIEKYESLIKGIIYQAKTHGITNGSWQKNTINITNGRFLENSISLPKTEDEAKRLATALTTIQKRIILEQSLLHSYQKQKLYLLRQMFV